MRSLGVLTDFDSHRWQNPFIDDYVRHGIVSSCCAKFLSNRGSTRNRVTERDHQADVLTYCVRKGAPRRFSNESDSFRSKYGWIVSLIIFFSVGIFENQTRTHRLSGKRHEHESNYIDTYRIHLKSSTLTVGRSRQQVKFCARKQDKRVPCTWSSRTGHRRVAISVSRSVFSESAWLAVLHFCSTRVHPVNKSRCDALVFGRAYARVILIYSVPGPWEARVIDIFAASNAILPRFPRDTGARNFFSFYFSLIDRSNIIILFLLFLSGESREIVHLQFFIPGAHAL